MDEQDHQLVLQLDSTQGRKIELPAAGTGNEDVEWSRFKAEKWCVSIPISVLSFGQLMYSRTRCPRAAMA